MKQAFRVLQIAFTYIGTVVGAGFATGQEILQFYPVWQMGHHHHWLIDHTICLAGHQNDAHRP